MGRRRKVGNLLALGVLSVVAGGPLHPYEMASVLRRRGKDADLDIKWGSLYTVVRNLDKHGLIEAVGSAREGRRPERTVYRITDAGRAELTDWVRELVAVPEREHPRFIAGLSMLAVLAPDEAIDLLRNRLARLEDDLATRRAALGEHRERVERLFLVEAEYELAIVEAEVEWVRGLLGELTSGTFPGLARWQAWHERGGQPSD
jgi:DNA-binding PadR family transcriptional regulator